jgi:S-adenosylmethionine-diacylglycerol 3-amino-3-carboxypropyl transferase
MAFLYNFGLSQEDEHTEARALALQAGDRVLSVASAGDMPLSLVALGAGSVDAVDIDPAQLHLTRLKLAAVRTLDRIQALAFLGFMPSSEACRRLWFDIAATELSDASRSYWIGHQQAVVHGAVWAGRYEQYVGRLVRLLLPVVGTRRFDDLFACRTLDEQHDVFARNFDLPRFRLLFAVAFHPKVYASRGMDARSLQHRDASIPLGDQFFEHFRALCTATLARDNHLLQLTLLGRILSPDATPAYLSQKGFPIARDASHRLRLHEADLLSFVADAEVGSFDKAHLSNVPDWLPQPAFDSLMRQLTRKAAPGARFVWRHIHVNRPLPEDLQNALRIDPEMGARLRESDRFPFYGIVPAQVIRPTDATASQPTMHSAPAARAQPLASNPRADAIQVGPVSRTEGDQLLAINRACPIEADFSLVFERSPEFFAWPDAIYDRYRYLGMRHEGRLVGYCMTGELGGWDGRAWGRMFYAGDARVLRAHRGGRLAEQGLRRALELVGPEVQVGFGLVKEGNQPAQRTVDTGHSEAFELIDGFRLEVVNIPLLWRLGRPSVTVRHVRRDDVEQLVSLHARANGGRLFALHVTAESIARDWERSGLGLERWVVAERGGRLVGALAAWDQRAFHRTTVLRFSSRARMLSAVYAGARVALPHAAPMPEPGESLRTLTITRLAVDQGDVQVLRAMLARVVDEHLGRGYHLVQVGFAHGDPLRGATAGLFCQRFRSRVAIVRRRGSAWRNAGSGPPMIDLAMI